ncbi:MAG: MarP family serine protease [Actinomycetota bacterium]|nr:MarP family serine protease [Actinomycetota bacterium]
MNLVDLIVLAVAAFASYRGWKRGFLGQVFELGGGFLGLLAGVALGPRIASLFSKQAGIEAALISLAVVFVALSVGQALGYIAGQKFGSIARTARLKFVDSGLGGAFGVAITLISFWLIGSLLVHGPSQSVARALKQSALLAYLNDELPQPPDVLAYLQQFTGLPPDIGPPVKLPSAATAHKAVEASRRSVVRVVVPACGGELLGSGWVAAPNYIVTNGHVVAGGHGGVRVQDVSGTRAGTVVLFDPKIDIAVIHVAASPALAGKPLSLATQTLDRGTPGATLGFPGNANGTLVTKAAAVQQYFPNAVGRDIYGRDQVARKIYDLRTVIRQGDSGGPFVLPDGRVAGVDFAASTTERDTGYALTAEQVQPDVQRGIARTAEVTTGACTH